jgi:hypothetical protein
MAGMAPDELLATQGDYIAVEFVLTGFFVASGILLAKPGHRRHVRVMEARQVGQTSNVDVSKMSPRGHVPTSPGSALGPVASVMEGEKGQAHLGKKVAHSASRV